MFILRDNPAAAPKAPVVPRRLRLGGPALSALLLMGAAIAAPGLARASDCSITYTADDAMTAVIEHEHFGFAGYDELCPALKAAHLKIDIDGDKGVLNDRAFVWVMVRLESVSTTVTSDFYRSTTKITTPADEETASKAAMDAVNESLEHIAAEKDKYIQSVAAEEARLRGLLNGKAAGKP